MGTHVFMNKFSLYLFQVSLLASKMQLDLHWTGLGISASGRTGVYGSFYRLLYHYGLPWRFVSENQIAGIMRHLVF